MKKILLSLLLLVPVVANAQSTTVFKRNNGAATVLQGTNLANSPASVTANGETFITTTGTPIPVVGATGSATLGSIASITTSVVPGVGITNLGKAEEQAHLNGDVGVIALSRRRDTAGSSATTTGLYATINQDADGRLATQIDGGGIAETGVACSAAATDTSNVQIKVAGGAGVRTYVRAIGCKNNSSVPSGIVFKDGTTQVWVGGVGVIGDPYSSGLLIPAIRGSVATAFQFAMDVTATSTICCIDFYTSSN